MKENKIINLIFTIKTDKKRITFDVNSGRHICCLLFFVVFIHAWEFAAYALTGNEKEFGEILNYSNKKMNKMIFSCFVLQKKKKKKKLFKKYFEKYVPEARLVASKK